MEDTAQLAQRARLTSWPSPVSARVNTTEAKMPAEAAPKDLYNGLRTAETTLSSADYTSTCHFLNLPYLKLDMNAIE